MSPVLSPAAGRGSRHAGVSRAAGVEVDEKAIRMQPGLVIGIVNAVSGHAVPNWQKQPSSEHESRLESGYAACAW